MGPRKIGNPIQVEAKKENNKEQYQDDSCSPIT